MGEHKLREVGNGDGEKKEPLSSHIVEIVTGDAKHPEALSAEVEAGYTRLGERAAKDNSLILGVVQGVAVASSEWGPFVVVTLTAQRVSKDDFERQQRMAQFGAGGPRR